MPHALKRTLCLLLLLVTTSAFFTPCTRALPFALEAQAGRKQGRGRRNFRETNPQGPKRRAGPGGSRRSGPKTPKTRETTKLRYVDDRSDVTSSQAAARLVTPPLLSDEERSPNPLLSLHETAQKGVKDIISMVYSATEAKPHSSQVVPSVYKAYMTTRATPNDRRIPTPTAAEAERVLKSGDYYLPRCFQGLVPRSGVHSPREFTMVAYNAPDQHAYKWRVGIRGVRVPSLEGKTRDERKWAHVARDYLRCRLEGKEVELNDIGYDDRGQVLATVEQRRGSELTSVGRDLIAKGLAVPCDGTGGRREVDWDEVARRPGTTVRREVLKEIEASERRLARQRKWRGEEEAKKGVWGVFEG